MSRSIPRVRAIFIKTSVLLACAAVALGAGGSLGVAHAQSVGPSGCVMYCDEPSGGGGSSGGGGVRYDPYAEMAVGAFGAFMNGFLSQLEANAARQNDPMWQATELNNTGVRLANAGRHDEAIGYYERALEIDPGNWIFQRNLELARDAYESQLSREAEQRLHEQRVGRVKGRFEELGATVTGGGEGLEFMDLNDTGVDEAKERVGSMLEQYADDLLNAPEGRSAWDGGYGGTLDDASALAVKGDYDGALGQIAVLKETNPDIPALDETEAYIKGLKAAKSPDVAARLDKSPSPMAEIVLDALEAGHGDWTVSLRYLEGMRINSGNDPRVSNALSYLRGVYAYQKVRGDPMPEPSKPYAPRKTVEPPTPQPPRPDPEEVLNRDLDELLSGEPFETDWAGLRASLRDMDNLLAAIEIEDISRRVRQGADAIEDGDLELARYHFIALANDYPDDSMLETLKCYVNGLYDAARRNGLYDDARGDK